MIVLYRVVTFLNITISFNNFSDEKIPYGLRFRRFLEIKIFEDQISWA